jgi:hypothetical protein
MAGRLQFLRRHMTHFDRFWEPVCFLVAFVIVWFGTL